MEVKFQVSTLGSHLPVPMGLVLRVKIGIEFHVIVVVGACYPKIRGVTDS